MVMITDSLIKKILREATTDSGSRGSYIAPLQPGLRDFQNKLDPFTTPVSSYKSPLVQYDSYDHTWDLRSDQIKELEKSAKKIQDYIKRKPYATVSDEDGNIINQTPSGKNKKGIVPIETIKEADTSISAGAYNGPVELGLKKWKKHILSPFDIEIDHSHNHHAKKPNMKNNIKKVVGIWEKDKNGSYNQEEHPTHFVNEDLAVWFGKKKKPKGSSQPKGPWVDICRKVDGKHPPCGRSDTSKGSYPKCRAAGVAGKMSDSQKRSACQQKRRAEKKDTQTGKGQKPVMTSYKPKKKLKEDMRQQIITLTESDIMKIVRRVLKEQNIGDDVSNLGNLSMKCIAYNSKTPYDYDLDGYTGKGKVEETGYGLGFNIVKSSNTPMDSVAGDSSQPVLVELEDMSVELRDYLIGRFPKNPITGEEIDWNNTAIDKKVIYVKNLVSSFKFACKVDEQRTNPNWMPFFKDTAYNLPIA